MVTVSICGNMAKRGSADCNMPASQGVRLFHVDTTPATSFAVSTPPGTCPCVIRASSDTGEVAYAPIEVRGVPTGPVVDPFRDESPLVVSVHAAPAPHGVLGTLKSWLGGPTPYAVEVTVQNQATEAFSTIAVHGAVGRNAKVDLAGFDMAPGALAAGQNWTGSANVELPAPVIGNYNWHVIASGAGPVTETTSTTRAVPWLLIVLILAFVGDVVAIWVRWVKRRRARKAAFEGDGPGDGGDWSVLPPPPPAPSPPAPPTVVTPPPSELVGVGSG